ncbi:hypothetical protein EG329_003164 [Mollisiaceae sp. DMI_Dod_QoI]|nr:hypothetical protein EG329_003164 [Helotiales sp. DMI_Dod_QoI]
MTSDFNAHLLEKITPHLRALREVFNDGSGPNTSLVPKLSTGLTSMSSTLSNLPASILVRIQEHPWKLRIVSAPGIVVPRLIEEWVLMKLKNRILALEGLSCEDLKGRLEDVSSALHDTSEEVQAWIQEQGFEVLWIIGGCLVSVFKSSASRLVLWICGFGGGGGIVIQSLVWDAGEEGTFAYLQSKSTSEARHGGVESRGAERGFGALVKLEVAWAGRVIKQNENEDTMAKEEEEVRTRENENLSDGNVSNDDFEDEVDALRKVEVWKPKSKL